MGFDQTKPELVAFIFARGGSKGLKNKNILPFAGKPLIAWSIEQALLSEGISRVIVSTDSPEIGEIAEAYGAEFPFLRPSDLAADQSPEWLSWRHAMKWYKQIYGHLPRAMISVPATSPLRCTTDIESCITKFNQSEVDIVISVTEANRNPYFNMVTQLDNGLVNLVCQPLQPVFRRQDAPVVYDMATVAYVVRPEFIEKAGSIFEGRVGAVTVPVERAIDIDTQLDFNFAEYLFLKRSGS